jgi:DNA ligase (NAD+)
MDIYQLDKHRDAIVAMDGFGEKSWARLWEAIQNSRNTTFERFLIAMDIPMIGNTASRALCQKFHGSLAAFENAVLQHYDFAQLPDFGETLSCNIAQWFEDEEHWYLWEGLQAVVMLQAPAPVPETTKDNPFVGLTIVVTGKVEPYTRTGINAKIESLGAHAGSSVSSKTDFLVCGENAGSKLDKARQLGVKVLTPAEFFRMAGE